MAQLSSSPLDRILELKDEVEKQKVELTPEVRAYIQTHLEIVQEKLRKGESVVEDDMQFIDEVRMWVAMPEEARKDYPSIEKMRSSEEVREALKRHITVLQWRDLLSAAEHASSAYISSSRKIDATDWIDREFQFPGGNKIHTKENLMLYLSPSLTHLPEGLVVGTDLELRNCPSLRLLPQDLMVRRHLDIRHCTSLSRLPRDLEVDGILYLSHDLQAGVKEDAENLKKEGKIKGKIIYN